MIANLFKVAIRSFSKNKGFTFLNVLGLSLGLAASILILQYVKYEKSFDSFHSNAENIYRVQYNMVQNGIRTVEAAVAVPVVGPVLKENYPQVKSFARLYPVNDVLTYRDEQLGTIAFREEKMHMADPELFEIFDFELTAGDVKTALTGINKLVLTKAAAAKYFQEEDPIGRILEWDSGYGIIEFEITGLLKEVPSNSHVKFDVLFSSDTWFELYGEAGKTSWTWYDYLTYVLLEENTSPNDFKQSFEEYLAEVRADHWQQYNYYQEFKFQPLKEIHLNSNFIQEAEPEEQGDANAVYFLTIIALFILFIAYINYINLATAKSMERANEVGVRKALGAGKTQLLRQFLFESFLVNLIACIVALLLVVLVWGQFGDLTGRTIPISYLVETEFWIGILILLSFGTFFSGVYPAFVLSSFEPTKVLKGKSSGKMRGVGIRKALVVFQFGASVALISGTVIVYQQLNFMNSSDLGFDINKKLVIDGPSILDSTYDSKVELLKNQFIGLANVEAVSVSSVIPGEEITWSRGLKRASGGPENNLTVDNVGVDSNFFEMFNIKMAAGRNFEKGSESDDNKMIINRALSDLLEFESPEAAVGEYIMMGGDSIEILGVVENYHHLGLTDAIKPIFYERWFSNAYYTIALKNEVYAQTLSMIKESWDAIFPGNPLDHFYLDQFFNKQYDQENRFGEAFGFFSFLAIFIACLGLFGLASFMTLQRTKEIGIRKTLGSTSSNVVYLLIKGFVQLVLVSNIIAWPICWWVMNRWLDSFPYRVEISIISFIFSGLGVLVVALLSVGFQTFKASLNNPAESLKYE